MSAPAWVTVALGPGMAKPAPVPESSSVAFAVTREGIAALWLLLVQAEKVLDRFEEEAK